jgi:ribosomal protein S3
MINKVKKFLKNLKKSKEYENREVARLIGEFYLSKNIPSKEAYEKARENIVSLGIVDIKTFRDTIIITLQRPGLLIGRKGKNIDELQKFIQTKTKYRKIDIKEDKIISCLIPYDYSNYPDDYLDI